MGLIVKTIVLKNILMIFILSSLALHSYAKGTSSGKSKSSISRSGGTAKKSGGSAVRNVSAGGSLRKSDRRSSTISKPLSKDANGKVVSFNRSSTGAYGKYGFSSRHTFSQKLQDRMLKHTVYKSRFFSNPNKFKTDLHNPHSDLINNSTVSFILGLNEIPLNISSPYYWMGVAVNHDQNNYKEQLSHKNFMINDDLITEMVLVDECLANASKFNINQKYCRDASYDFELAIKGVTDPNLIDVNVGFEIYIGNATLPSSNSPTTYLKNSDSSSSPILLHSVGIREIIADLDDSNQLVIQLNKDLKQTLNISTLLTLAENLKSIDELTFQNRLVMNISVKKRIIDDEVNMNLTQPLGLDLEAVRDCARFLDKLGVSTKLCLKQIAVKTLLIGNEDKTASYSYRIQFDKDLKENLFYNAGKLFYGDQFIDSLGYLKLTNLADYFASLYEIFYATNTSDQFGKDLVLSQEANFFITDRAFCNIDLNTIESEAIDSQVCEGTHGAKFEFGFIRQSKNILLTQFSNLIKGAYNGLADQADIDEYFEKFNIKNIYQIEALQILLENDVYLTSEKMLIVKDVTNGEALLAIEKEFENSQIERPLQSEREE